MKYAILALTLAAGSVHAWDTDYDYTPNYGYTKPYHNPNTQSTVIPQLGGGYVVKESWGSTTVTPPDAFGVVNIYRRGTTSW